MPTPRTPITPYSPYTPGGGLNVPFTPHSYAVSEPEPFPNPVIRRSVMKKVNVLLNNGSVVEKRTAIDSGSGKCYELGTQLKKAIFGQVIHAILLRPLDAENYVRTNEEMAIKIYSKKILRALQGKTQENPLMEITALQFLGDEHPNIMGQIECCTDEENIYSIMKFCKGGELFDYIDENGPMEEPQAREMFRQLLAGMARLSELGIAHRDMSLENILYDGHNLYVIIDFGMCVRLKRIRNGENNSNSSTPHNNNHHHHHPTTPSGGSTTPHSINSGVTTLAADTNPRSHRGVIDHYHYCHIAKQTICGKKNYISPEVLRGDEFFNPLLCDIWAAGIILFIALTGVPPVDKATHADERFSMICDNRLGEMLDAWNMDVSPAAVDLIQNLLRPNPQDRLSLTQMMDHPWLQG